MHRSRVPRPREHLCVFLSRAIARESSRPFSCGRLRRGVADHQAWFDDDALPRTRLPGPFALHGYDGLRATIILIGRRRAASPCLHLGHREKNHRRWIRRRARQVAFSKRVSSDGGGRWGESSQWSSRSARRPALNRESSPLRAGWEKRSKIERTSKQKGID